MDKAQAIQEVIKLKKQYGTGGDDKAINQKAETIRKQYGLDDSKYGSGATLAQAYTNYYKEYVGANQAKPVQAELPKQAPAFEPAPYQPTKYDMQIESLINSLPANMLNYDQAKGMADEQLGASYDKALTDTMKNIDRQSLQTGFFGQLPTVDYKQRNADEIERSRAASIAQLASQLVNDSKADVQSKINALSSFSQNMSDSEYKNWQKQLQQQQYTDSRGDVDWEKAFKERDYTDSRNDVDWEKLFKERQYTDSRTDAEWQKGVTESQLTGIFKGNPTMALTELTHKMNIDTKQMEMAEKKMNHDITMSWENLKNDRIGLGQAAQRIGLQSAGLSLDNKKFLAGVKEKAFDMAKDTFGLTMGGGSSGGEMSWLIDSPSGGGQSKVSNGDVMDLMDTYTKILLGEANINDIYNTEIGRFYNTSNNRYDGRTK